MEQFSLEKYLENPNRKVVTRDGRSVRIICTNRLDKNYPVIALVHDEDSELCYSYTIFGNYNQNKDTELDLFFAPDKKSGWINLYKSGNGWSLGANIWQTEAEAKKWVGATDYTATIKIEWEE